MSKLGARSAHAADGDVLARKRSTSPNPMRRLAAAVAAVALGTGLALAGIAAPASATGDGNGGKVCQNFDTGHLSANDEKTWVVTAPEGELIAEVCVKAGSDKQGDGPVVTVYDPPVKSVEISHPSGKDISHYSVRYVDEPTTPEEPELVTIDVEPTSIDLCGVANDAVSHLTDTDAIDWETVGEVASGTVVVTATAKPGYVFAKDATTSWTFHFTDTPCSEEPEEATIEIEPESVDQCGTANDAFTLPSDTDAVTWKVDGSVAAGEVTITAIANDGYTFAEGTKTSWTFAFTDTPCEEEPAEPSLEGSVATGTCVADAPWIFFDVVLTDPDHQVTNREVSLVLTDGENTETIELGTLDENGELEGKTLWPGAAVDDEGNAIAWPGWKQLDDGTWVKTDGNYAWTHDLTSAKFVVNPELEVALAYPPATPDCIAAPPVTPAGPADGDGEGETPSTPADDQEAAPAGGSGLAETGFAGTSIAIVAGVIVLAGAAFVVVARLRRKNG